MSNGIETISENRCFGGVQGVYGHRSAVLDCDMRFSLFRPPQSETESRPVLFWLSGLTCNEENFIVKAGAQRLAAELGLIVVAPDTSPRGVDLAGENDTYDFGSGAGFYVDATEQPWAKHYRMYSYVTGELPALIGEHFPVRPGRQGIFGHSMGGHGALVMALRNPGAYLSVSAFAPIVAPMQCPWGEKAFSGYLGGDRENWKPYDATELVRGGAGLETEILIDQGTADGFLGEQLKPHLFEEVCRASGQALKLRLQEGYDHSYFFIASFMEYHLRHHAERLCG